VLKSRREPLSSGTSAANLLQSASYAVALTGAGVSTPSGIPDFRSPESGLWEQVDGAQVASISGFVRNPGAFYEWIRPLATVVLDAQPNPAHTALAELERAGCLRAVITQNIDGLHQQAGSQEVLELHGHVRELICLHCGRAVSTAERLRGFLDSGKPPECPHCGTVMKPRAVLFGEELPSDTVARAVEHVRRADLMLVVGSSLSVTPASELPLVVRSNGGLLIVVNLTPTYADAIAECVIREDVAKAMPRIADAFSRMTGRKRLEK
jgi:NAD-dependent deacetylase